MRETLDGGITPGIVLVGAAYGTVTLWREQLAEWGLSYCVDVPEGISAWPPGSPCIEPARGGPTRWQQTTEPSPLSAQALADNDSQDITWREGTNKPLCSQFACGAKPAEAMAGVVADRVAY